MKRFLLHITIILILLTTLQKPVKAQYVLKEADTQYELFNYTKAIDLYEQAWKKKESLHTAERLAAAYQLVQNYKEAESWYAIAVNMEGSVIANRLNYAKALQNNGKYSEAKMQYQKYAGLNNMISSNQLSTWYLSCDSALKWMRSPKPIALENVKLLNSAQSDWGTVAYQGGVVFSSDRTYANKDKQTESRPFLKFDGTSFPDQKIYGWTGNGYLRLYFKNKMQDSVQLFPLQANTNYHIGGATFSADGKEIYFTLTRIPTKLDQNRNKLGTINVEIYSSRLDATGKWLAPVPFAYNNVNEYSVGDPFLTNGGNTLYFSSNMPGGLGGTDLYACFRTADGAWGKPINLKEVNTEGNERSPSFDADNNLYFSSDGRVGMGGLDIYKAAPSTKGTGIGTIENMAYPINSPQDDFALNANVGDGKIFFSSNRTGGLGSDDIYSYTEQQMPLALKFEGVAYNKKTNTPLANAIVSLNKVGGGNLKVETADDGKFSFSLEENSAYKLIGEKTNYQSDEYQFSTVGLKKSDILKSQLYLAPIEINKAIRLENIYYDFNKADIRPDAAVELNKLVKIMQDNPTIWIELGSHTDSRGNDQYNQWLSQRRANAAVQYIIDRGIAKNRITAKGYGESQLLNQCANGIKCSEAAHQLNRRTEFKIVKQ